MGLDVARLAVSCFHLLFCASPLCDRVELGPDGIGSGGVRSCALVGGLLEGALSLRGGCRCVLSREMVTINSYDLGVTANTLQYITPWPGDKSRHITPRWRSRRFRNTVFPSSVLRSLALSRESARTYRQRGLLARPFLNQSTLFVRQQRHRVASPSRVESSH
jgi:hypothetical protein